MRSHILERQRNRMWGKHEHLTDLDSPAAPSILPLESSQHSIPTASISSIAAAFDRSCPEPLIVSVQCSSLRLFRPSWPFQFSPLSLHHTAHHHAPNPPGRKGPQDLLPVPIEGIHHHIGRCCHPAAQEDALDDAVTNNNCCSVSQARRRIPSRISNVGVTRHPYKTSRSTTDNHKARSARRPAQVSTPPTRTAAMSSPSSTPAVLRWTSRTFICCPSVRGERC